MRNDGSAPRGDLLLCLLVGTALLASPGIVGWAREAATGADAQAEEAPPPNDDVAFLEAAAQTLRKAVGGKWRVTTRERAEGLGPELSSGSFSSDRVAVPYVVLPFPLDEAGRQKLKLFRKHCSAGLVLLGTAERCTALAGDAHDWAVSRKVVEALGLSRPPAQAAGYGSAWHVASFQGRVVDADTGKPVLRCRLQFGWSDEADADRIVWGKPFDHKSKDGSFGCEIHLEPGRRACLRVLADGYVTAPPTPKPIEVPARAKALVIRLTRTR